MSQRAGRDSLRAGFTSTRGGLFLEPMEGAAAKTKIFGQHDEATLKQIERCVAAGGERGVLCADGHKGYAQPIGGVVAYKDKISLRLFSAGRSIVGPTEFQVYAAYQLTLGPGK